MIGPVPEQVRQLAAERSAARAARDFARADALRDRIRALGWDPVDGPAGTSLRPTLAVAQPGAVAYASADDLGSRLDGPARLDLSIVTVAETHLEDLRRLLTAVAAHPPRAVAAERRELIVVLNGADAATDEGFIGSSGGPAPIVIRTGAALGWADAVNLGLRRTLGEVVVLLDPSVEPTGDAISPLAAAFEDVSVGLAGGFGLRSSDMRQFHDAPPGEVDAVQGYFLAVRREALRAVGGFDHRFRFYRNADLDFSFAVRAAGWRAVATGELPLVLHEHRAYAALDPEERDRLSRRNFYRFLDHWRDRADLLLDR